MRKEISKGHRVEYNGTVYGCFLHMIPLGKRKTPTQVMYCRKIAEKPQLKPMVREKGPCSKLEYLLLSRRNRIYEDLITDVLINADPYENEGRLREVEGAIKIARSVCPAEDRCERMMRYIEARKRKIEEEIKRDEELDIDPYANQLRLQEVKEVERDVRKTICRRG